MFPGSFDYVAPTSIDDALSFLSEHGEEAKVLAGGQSLIPLMKLRFAAPDHIVDINRIPGLDFIEEDATQGSLRVGALVRNRSVERSDLIGTNYPTMAAVARSGRGVEGVDRALLVRTTPARTVAPPRMR